MYIAFWEGFKNYMFIVKYWDKISQFTAMNNEQRLHMLRLSQSNMNEYGDEVVSNPTTAEGWKEIAASYSSRWNFHYVLGALDGNTFAYGVLPMEGPSSLTLRMLLARRSLSNSIDISQQEPLPGDERPIPYFIIGDNAFALNEWMMKSFAAAPSGIGRVGR